MGLLKRTPGISNPVDARRAELERMADEDHAKGGDELIRRLVQRDRQRSWIARIKSKLAGVRR